MKFTQLVVDENADFLFVDTVLIDTIIEDLESVVEDITGYILNIV